MVYSDCWVCFVARLVCLQVDYHMDYLVDCYLVGGTEVSLELDSKDCMVSYSVVYNRHQVEHEHHLRSSRYPRTVFLFSDDYHDG